MTFSQGDIHNHLRGARQGDARERYVFIVAVKLSIEFGNDLLLPWIAGGPRTLRTIEIRVNPRPILARLLVVKSFPELGHYGIVAGKVPTHPGSTRLLYACVEVWRALISRRLGFGDMAGQIVI